MKLFWRRWWVLAVLAILGGSTAYAQQGLAVRSVEFEPSENNARMVVEMDLGLNDSLRSALEGGSEIEYVAELHIIKDGWLFNNVFKRYRWVAVLRRRSLGQGYEYHGFAQQLWQTADSTREAFTQMNTMTLLFEDPVELRDMLDPEVFFSHRVEVNLSKLSNPLQVDLLTSNDWLFSSGWYISQH